MSTLSFFSTVYDNKKATEYSLRTVREFYPDAYYMLIGDGGSDHIDLAKKYNCDFYYNNIRLGYPEQPFGYKKEKVLEWLMRFYISCLKCNSDYIMMVEDDVVLLDKITIQDDWECVGHVITHGNKIPKPLLDACEKISGQKLKTDFYGSGGGSIFKVRTVLENFGTVYGFFNNNLDFIQESMYPTLGWLDCFTTFFFYLCGKSFTQNEKMYNIFPVSKTFDLNTLKGQYEIVHGYKNYYE